MSKAVAKEYTVRAEGDHGVVMVPKVLVGEKVKLKILNATEHLKTLIIPVCWECGLSFEDKSVWDLIHHLQDDHLYNLVRWVPRSEIEDGKYWGID